MQIQGVDAYNGALGRVELDAAYQAATLKLQKNAMQAVGDAALKLLDAAMVMDNSVGQNLNVSA